MSGGRSGGSLVVFGRGSGGGDADGGVDGVGVVAGDGRRRLEEVVGDGGGGGGD